MTNKLTEKAFWEEYWLNYRFTPVPNRMFFHNYLPTGMQGSFIEVGGFPGLTATYIYKNFTQNVSILDYHINKDIVNRVEKENGLPVNAIKTIEQDFFSFTSDIKYDLVFSLGFIEHFEDTKDVIKRHIDLGSENSTFLIILPNLRGINGWIQYLFDRKNLEIHNLKSMDINYLKQIMKELNVKNVSVEYYRKPMVWLEPKPTLVNKIGRIFTKCLSYTLKLFPIKCRLLSSYIVISASKN